MPVKWLLTWFGGGMLLAFLLPNHFSPWLSFHQEAMAAIAIAPLFLWAGVRAQRVSVIVWMVILLAITPILQWQFGLLAFLGDALMYSIFLLGLALAILVGHVLATEAPDEATLDNYLKPLWLSFLVAGIFSVGLAAHQWLDLARSGVFIADVPQGGRPFANLAQPNHLATLLLLSTLGAWYGWEKRWLGTFAALICVLFLMTGMVLSGSRSIWLAIAWLLPAIAWTRSGNSSRLSFPIAVALAATYFLLGFLKPVVEELIGWSSTGTALDRVAQTHFRLLAWTAFSDAALIEPWLGYGWGQIAQAQFRVALNHPGMTEIFYNSHNIILDLMLWVGVPLAAVIVLMVAYWIFVSIYRSCSINTLLPLLAVLIVLGHSMVEFPITYAYFLLPVGFWIGVVTGTMDKLQPYSIRLFDKLPKIAIYIVVLSTLVLSIQIIYEYIPFEEDWRRQQFVDAKIEQYSDVEATNPILLTQLGGLMQLQRLSPREQSHVVDTVWIKKVAERYPYPAFRYKYALALAINAKFVDATDQLLRICAVFSRDVCEQVKRDWSIAAEHDSRLSGVDLLKLP